MKSKACILSILLLLLSSLTFAKTFTYDLEKMGYSANGHSNFSPILTEVIAKIKAETTPKDNIILKFYPGKYVFKTEGTTPKEYYISNHDQVNPRNVAMDFSGIDNLTVDGQGAEFLFEGRITPIVATKCNNLKLKNFTIDFIHPQIMQLEIIKNLGDKGMVYHVAPWSNYDIDKGNGKLVNYGEGWKIYPIIGIVFDRDTKHIIYNISDISFNTEGSDSIDTRIIESPKWVDSRLKTGMTISGRSVERPAPGIFMAENKDSYLEDVTVHYAEGMGLIAQRCENISLLRFNVCLRSKSDPRCFTTQADATHFSGCKGKITSIGGRYENMMDDAINVHGTYLKVLSISDDRKEVTARFMHHQSWGFKWGEEKDSLVFIRSNTLDECHRTAISSISAKENITIKLDDPLPSDINAENGVAIENITWTPEVEFSENIIKNNRARGCLFSTIKKVVVSNNLFSNVSGCAILLSGDCNGWFESGPCNDITITKNRFIDVLTSLFGGTNAIISIIPNIPDLNSKKDYYHSGIKIEDNYFETFDRPILFAQSVDGLTFRKNIIYGDTRFKPYHPNKYTYNLQKVINYKIENNKYSGYTYNESEDLHVE